MHYFITGTAGFIGFHLARRLLADGHQVTGFDGMTPYYNVKLKQMRHAAPDLLQILTGYTPRTKLEDGVNAFVEWYLEYYKSDGMGV